MYTIEMYNTLVAAIGTGTRSVYYGDKRVDYRSLAEMLQIRSLMAIELGIELRNTTRHYAEFNDATRRPCGDGIEGGECDNYPYYD